MAVAGFGDSALASCHIYAVDDDYAMSHLAATSAWGYANGGAYLVEDAALRELSDRVVNLGGSAGLTTGQGDGLAVFKAGFANRTQQSLLLGAVLDDRKYAALTEGLEPADFFPAYRAP